MAPYAQGKERSVSACVKVRMQCVSMCTKKVSFEVAHRLNYFQHGWKVGGVELRK